MMNKQPSEDRGFSLEQAAEVSRNEKERADSEIVLKQPACERKRRRKEMTEEERREERRTANRRSAFESRHRRKVLIEELQDAVERLTKENAAVRKEADSLRLEVERLKTENRKLSLQQQLSRSIPVSGLTDVSTFASQLDSGLWNMSQGLEQGISQNLTQGLSQSLTQGLSQSLTQGLSPRLTQGLSQRLTQGLPHGLAQRIPQGLARGLTQDLTQGMPLNLRMSGLSSLNRFMPTDSNIRPLLARSNVLDSLPTDDSLSDQTREYIRSLQDRQGPLR